MHPNRTLFETYAQPPADSRLLICNPHDVQYVASLTEHAARVDIFPRYFPILQSLRARIGGRTNVTIHETIFPTGESNFNMAMLDIPKGRELARTWMAAALMALGTDGILYAAGPNKGGAKTAFTDLNQITRASNLGSKARHRIFSAMRPADLTIPPDWTQPGDYLHRTFTIHGENYELVTHPGVFSYDHLDDGTSLLLDQLVTLEIPPGLRVLDAGCGIGVIGMVAARTLQPQEVVLVDSDLLAIHCVRQSLPEGEVIAADLMQQPLTEVEPFDLILCNPPFHQDHAQSTRFMTSFAGNARRMLVHGGQLILVYNHFLPYRELLGKHFDFVQVLAEDGRYVVIRARPIVL
jgi:16S rRNA (guanine1207-N2)-methyltransferase